MGINLKGIEIETKIKGIRIKIEADNIANYLRF
jgi:hypothetical protein